MANPDWAILPPPSLADFETLSEAAYARLPEDFRALCQAVVIRVDDFPGDDVLDQMGCETEFDLLGLFTGRGLAQGGA
jgi:predicted Zn-dependent protease with MMP-like domain